MSERVVVFTTVGCPYCKRAKQALRELEVPFQEVDVSGQAELRGLLKSVTGETSVPQVPGCCQQPACMHARAARA